MSKMTESDLRQMIAGKALIEHLNKAAVGEIELSDSGQFVAKLLLERLVGKAPIRHELTGADGKDLTIVAPLPQPRLE